MLKAKEIKIEDGAKKDEILGILYPSIEEIGKAIAKRDKARIIPTGAFAQHLLGLSTQIPMNVIYLTDGSARKIKIGKQTIVFKKTSPKNLSYENQLSSLIIQSLKSKKENKIYPDPCRLYSYNYRGSPLLSNVYLFCRQELSADDSGSDTRSPGSFRLPGSLSCF